MDEIRCRYVKGPFWSNCLVEAIKAKLHDPFHTKITVVWRSEAGIPHFLWSAPQGDFDFGVERRLTGFQKIWFEGYIRKRRSGFNERYKRLMQERWSRRRDGADE